MTTQKNICAIKTCGRPSPDSTLCADCIDHLTAEVNRFTYQDLFELHEIALREIRPAERNIRTTGKRSLRQDALNVVAWTLWEQLTQTWPELIPTLTKATIHDARMHYQQIDQGTKTARRLIEGSPEPKLSPDHVEQKMREIGTMSPEDASKWLWKNMRIRISHWRIQKWNQQGKLTPRTTSDRVNYYHPKDILETLEASREGNMSVNT